MIKSDLRTPCCECPFRRDCLKGWLGRSRAAELIETIKNDYNTFQCHKTINDRDTQQCAGAAILLIKMKRPNILTRIAIVENSLESLNFKNEKFVFDKSDEFINHHT